MSNASTFVYRDSSLVEHQITFKADSFDFKQRGKKITDVSIKGKPTTFVKDCFRRFCKSKSSIVAAVILGILVVLSVVIPVALPFDITGGTTSGLEYLPPKLFPTGTGFWDGTTSYKDIVYDKETGLPQGNYDEASILKDTLKTYEGYLDNTPNAYATGGYIRIATEGDAVDVWNGTAFNLADIDNLTMSYDIETNVEDLYAPVPFKIWLSTGDQTYYLVDGSTDYGAHSDIDVSSILKEKNVDSLDNVTVHVGIDGVPEGETNQYGLFLKTFSLNQNGNPIIATVLDDANKALLNNTWRCSSLGKCGLAQAVITYCSFTYNPYQEAYGNVTMKYSVYDIQDMIDAGELEYDFDVGPSSFKALTDTCPIVEVTDQREVTAAGITTIEITATVARYKEKGFSSMPYHIFGTDSNGRDMLKYIFSGLRNSLALAILVSAICFFFGLIYGSIEGYFGGAVDLIMERIVDVLANIPSIILITIIVLHLGRDFGIFLLSMCLTGWIGSAGITRTQFYRFKRREYVLASRSLGASDARLIYRHILPNGLGTIVTSSVLMIPSVIFSEATIAYLGIGLSGLPSLGNILNDNQNAIGINQYLLIFPSLIMAILLICFNLFGNGLRDALNPSLKGSE